MDFVVTDRPYGDGCGIATAFVVEETGAGWVLLKVTVAIRGQPTTFEEPSCPARKDSSTLSMLTAQYSTEDSSCRLMVDNNNSNLHCSASPEQELRNNNYATAKYS